MPTMRMPTLVHRRLEHVESDAEGVFAGGEEGLLVGLLLGDELKRERLSGGGGDLTDGETGGNGGGGGCLRL